MKNGHIYRNLIKIQICFKPKLKHKIEIRSNQELNQWFITIIAFAVTYQKLITIKSLFINFNIKIDKKCQ